MARNRRNERYGRNTSVVKGYGSTWESDRGVGALVYDYSRSRKSGVGDTSFWQQSDRGNPDHISSYAHENCKLREAGENRHKPPEVPCTAAASDYSNPHKSGIENITLKRQSVGDFWNDTRNRTAEELQHVHVPASVSRRLKKNGVKNPNSRPKINTSVDIHNSFAEELQNPVKAYHGQQYMRPGVYGEQREDTRQYSRKDQNRGKDKRKGRSKLKKSGGNRKEKEVVHEKENRVRRFFKRWMFCF